MGRSDAGVMRVDGSETVGNSLGGAPLGRSDLGSDDSVDGGEAVGNSLGRDPWGRNETEATIGCMEEKPWEIAWGELRGGRSNDEMVDGGENPGK